ncbi:MAG: ABC transporter permease subunit [Anaerolineae bacterium]
MFRSVFLKTLYDQRRSILGWGLGLGALGLLTLLFYPSVKAAGAAYDEILRTMPREYLAFFGNVTSFTEIEGYIIASLLIYLPPVLAIYSIGAALSMITGEIEGGQMDILMAHPLPRWRIVLEKYAALATAVVAICLILGLCLGLGGLIIRSDIPHVSPERWLVAGLHVAPLTIFLGSVAFALACVFRGRFLPIAAATTLSVGSFILNGLTPLVERLQALKKWNPYYWYAAGKPLSTGILPEGVALLLGLSLVFLGLGIAGFGRRDVLA